MESEFSTVSFVNNRGMCEICWNEFKEGWINDDGEYICDGCKKQLQKPADDDILKLLSNQPFVEFEIHETRWDN